MKIVLINDLESNIFLKTERFLSFFKLRLMRYLNRDEVVIIKNYHNLINLGHLYSIHKFFLYIANFAILLLTFFIFFKNCYISLLYRSHTLLITSIF